MTDRDQLIASLKALMAARDVAGSAPAAEELVDYHEGRLQAAKRARLEERLEEHPEAARALADLEAFPDVQPAPGVERLTPGEVDAGWQSFRARLVASAGEEGAEAEGGPRRRVAPPEEPAGGSAGTASPEARGARPTRRPPEATAPILPTSRRFWVPAMAAAGLVALFMAGGAGYWIGQQRSPVVNPQVVALRPLAGELERSAAAPATTVAVPPAGSSLVLLLATADAGEHDRYRLRVETADGTPVWSSDELRPTAADELTVAFPPGYLDPGRYRLEVEGVRGDRVVPVGTWEVEVVLPERPAGAPPGS